MSRIVSFGRMLNLYNFCSGYHEYMKQRFGSIVARLRTPNRLESEYSMAVDFISRRTYLIY